MLQKSKHALFPIPKQRARAHPFTSTALFKKHSNKKQRALMFFKSSSRLKIYSNCRRINRATKISSPWKFYRLTYLWQRGQMASRFGFHKTFSRNTGWNSKGEKRWLEKWHNFITKAQGVSGHSLSSGHWPSYSLDPQCICGFIAAIYLLYGSRKPNLGEVPLGLSPPSSY